MNVISILLPSFSWCELGIKVEIKCMESHDLMLHKMTKGVLNVCCSFDALNKAFNYMFLVFASIVVDLVCSL